MFHLYQSNKVEVLLAQLIRLLLNQQVSPLQPQTVVVENPGLAHWLKMQLANSLGIAANIEFPMPSRFFWQVQRTLQPDLADESVFSKDTLSWLVLECLQDPSIINRENFQLLKNYLNENTQSNDATDQSDKRDVTESNQQQALTLFQLAQTIADLYDQYLVYRPDWIENWEKQNYEFDDSPLAEHQWQGELWWEIIQKVKAKDLPVAHRASLLQDFLDVLQGPKNVKELPESVIFFGFSTLPKHQVEALSLLSSHMDVHVLTPNPCEHYWGDILDEKVQARLRLKNKTLHLQDAGNDLLASLGTLGKDYQRLLLDVDNIQEHDLFVTNENNSVLAQLQNQILHLQQGKHTPLDISVADSSVKAVGCHSPMREIEVLHDHLLQSFNQDENGSGNSLVPQDVVVMIPDVASYAPYIDAVFNSSKPFIPYSISDRPIQAEHPLLSAVSTLLDLPKGRLSFSEVLGLLEIPAVYRAYGLTESHIPQLKAWLLEAGIRWGFDEQHREQHKLPKWQQNTWIYGFRRLLMGYAVSHGQTVEGVTPVTSVEGLDAMWLGPLMNFVQDLHDFIEKTAIARTASQWSIFINQTLNDFVLPEEQENFVLEHVYQALDECMASMQKIAFDQEIEFSVLVDMLKQRLQKTAGSQHFMVGKVNFCTLLPMRSIPFKMVAVLGLNDADYPRSVTPNSLDLMRFKRRLGDRSRRDEDRYLFLEAILSARESLWLSYKSRDQKEDKPMTPSVVLAELFDYLNSGFTLNNQPLLDGVFKQHPLQAFDKTYFSNDSSLFSFNHDWLAAHDENENKKELEKITPVQVEHDSDILLDDLIGFFQNPAKDYLNKKLNINLGLWADKQEDEEPFNLDGLEQFKLKQAIIDEYIQWLNTPISAQQDKAPFSLQHNISEGLLAFGEIGQKQWQTITASVQPVLDLCSEYLVNQQEQLTEINISLKSLNTHVLGWLSNVYETHMVNVAPNRLNAKLVLKLMIEQACLNVMGVQKTAVLICQDHSITLQAKQVSEAREYLLELCKLYQQGLETPLAFLPETAWQLVRPNKQGGRTYNNERHSLDAFFGTQGMFAKAGERDDLHVLRCFDELDDIPEESLRLSEAVFAPWLEQLEINAHD